MSSPVSEQLIETGVARRAVGRKYQILVMFLQKNGTPQALSA